MDISELMIGDIVKYNGCIAKIYSIHGSEPRYGRFDIVNYVTLSLDGLIDAMCDDIEPIPLTPEILEKNGFSKYEEKGHAPCYYIQRFAVNYHYHGNYYYIQSEAVDIRIRYVHELQHALRLCGLFELADKLKA